MKFFSHGRQPGPVRPRRRVVLPVLLALPLCFQSLFAGAQYYYKDIWNNQRLAREFNSLKRQHVSDIKLSSFEGDDQPSDGFFCEKKINHAYSQSQMLSKSNITGQSVLTVDYNQLGQPVRSVDETPHSTNTTEYRYDSLNRLASLRTLTRDDDDSAGITEVHEYTYSAAGFPARMVRSKNGIPVSTITFVTDSVGNVTEEDPSGSTADTKFYYYYDAGNRLTDVVHFNERAQRLLPEYMYEYNDQNLPVQMISTEEGSSNYFIWRYAYNDRNLLESETCFSKQKELLGTIRYAYN